MDSTCNLLKFAARMREIIDSGADKLRVHAPPSQFDVLAMELFGLQFVHNEGYRLLCESKGIRPGSIKRWQGIPAVPAAAFKDWDLTSIAPQERASVFYSSGTTAQRRSRHFHSHESLGLYRASVVSWFKEACGPLMKSASDGGIRFMFLTPPPEEAPHSSLVHMFQVLREEFGAAESHFYGRTSLAGLWEVDGERVLKAARAAADAGTPLFLAGTAYSFVHVTDFLAQAACAIRLPAGSVAMETGGYKGRSREVEKPELHRLISEEFGIQRRSIATEYGMCELGSQAYALAGPGEPGAFVFPPWARVRVVSPEDGGPVADGELGMIRVFDLANVYSVLAVQTEDVGRRRGDGFDLIGRAELTEARGCSLMSA